MEDPEKLIEVYGSLLNEGLLRKWYPLVIDRECGGYFTNITADWTVAPEQEKMIVGQARHIWATARAAAFLADGSAYEEYARHGFLFLRDAMWDRQFGGFFQIRGRSGGWSDVRGWRDEKRTYGNAFGVYALAALYALTRDPEVLEFAKQAFCWIEDHAYDPRFKGYFQFLSREGKVFDSSSEYQSIASDNNEVGFKDQNSSIHLLEAYTELYRVWKDPTLREQLSSLLTLIRDTMVTRRGYLQLFFHPDWSPVSFKDCEPALREKNFGLDHVSVGHDYETAFLMLEASHSLGLENDTRTLAIARKMLDHALASGWDNELGGFYDGGYYFKGEDRCTIIHPTKNWWAQAEALNALLLFSKIFPEAGYETYFMREWEYVRTYIIDWDGGDWFEGGLDKEPHLQSGPKSHIWKCTYHTTRALTNCITMLGGGTEKGRKEMAEFVDHWKFIGSQ
ncbi:N-acylglucosamine 2-epimerase [bacterium]|nr:MAG: N-acylglucosamine 2-epimerase [bacterium]